MRVFDAGIGEEIGDELSFAGNGVLDDDPVEVLHVDQSLSETSQFGLLDGTSVGRGDSVDPGELIGHEREC